MKAATVINLKKFEVSKVTASNIELRKLNYLLGYTLESRILF